MFWCVEFVSSPPLVVVLFAKVPKVYTNYTTNRKNGKIMLDKLSKKIVQHMNTAESPSDTYYDFMDDLDEIAENTHSDSESVRAAVRYLEEQGYIKYSYTQNGIAFQFYLDHKGLHWKYFRRKEILDYIAEKWPDFIAVAISMVSLLISIASLTKEPG